MLTQKEWPVPDKYNKMPNPLKGDAASLATGKELWAKHCQSCHGKSGKGDGSKAAQLKTTLKISLQPKCKNKLTVLFFIKLLKDGKTCLLSKRRYRMKMIYGLL
jgi:hypothetical protein